MSTSEFHVIERRSDGYRPPMRVIRSVLRLAKRQGLRTDWDCVGVLESGALSFGCMAQDMEPTNLIAIKTRGGYKFMTEREYLEMPR